MAKDKAVKDEVAKAEETIKEASAQINAKPEQTEQSNGDVSPNQKRLQFLVQERDKAGAEFNRQRELHLKYQGAVELLVGIMKEDGEITEQAPEGDASQQ